MISQQMVIPGFSTQEVMALTGMTQARLNYLDRSGQIVPMRLGKSKRAALIYSWSQIIQLKFLDMISVMSTAVVLDVLSKIEEFINDISNLKKKDLVIIDSQVYWVEVDLTLSELTKFVREQKRVQQPNPEQIYSPVTHYNVVNTNLSIKEVIVDVINKARQSELIDFEEFKVKIKYQELKENLDLVL